MKESLMTGPCESVPAGYSYAAIAGWFVAGAVVTSVFSGSLAALAENAGLTEVLLVGMLVPSFTWAVQLVASGIALPAAQRRLYWGDLGRVCLVGSLVLLPGALINLCLLQPPLWLSAANVLASVAIMGTGLFGLSDRHGIAFRWPLSWCLTIAVNMMLFVWFSRNWWHPHTGS
jgi:hypothetical protein